MIQLEHRHHSRFSSLPSPPSHKRLAASLTRGQVNGKIIITKKAERLIVIGGSSYDPCSTAMGASMYKEPISTAKIICAR
jgi:hypothetical protein